MIKIKMENNIPAKINKNLYSNSQNVFNCWYLVQTQQFQWVCSLFILLVFCVLRNCFKNNMFFCVCGLLLCYYKIFVTNNQYNILFEMMYQFIYNLLASRCTTKSYVIS